MSVVGFEHVFAEAVEKELAPETVMKVAPLRVLALLKIVAYMDDPHGRSKDLEDLGRLMEQYELEGERRFGEEVFEAPADFESAGAFLLGLDVGRLCTGGEAKIMGNLIATLQDDSQPAQRLLGERTRRGISDRGKAKADRSVCCGFCHWTAAKRRSVKLRFRLRCQLRPTVGHKRLEVAIPRSSPEKRESSGWFSRGRARRSKIDRPSNSQAHPAKTRGTRTVQPKPVPLGF